MQKLQKIVNWADKKMLQSRRGVQCELTTEEDYLPGNTSLRSQKGFTDWNWDKTEHQLGANSRLDKVIDDCDESQANREAHVPGSACPWRPCADGAEYFVLAAFPLRLRGCVCLRECLPPPPLLLCLPGKKWKTANLSRAEDLNSAYHSTRLFASSERYVDYIECR